MIDKTADMLAAARDAAWIEKGRPLKPWDGLGGHLEVFEAGWNAAIAFALSVTAQQVQQAQQIEDLTREVERLREIIIDIGKETVVCADAYKKMGLPIGNDFEIEIDKLKENVNAARTNLG